MTTLGLEQFVSGPTHRCGHTLDVVISRENDNLVENTHVLDLISDHALVACTLCVRKPPVPRTTITSRKYRSIDCANLNEDVVSSELTISLANTADAAVDQYNKVLSDLLDQHAPSCTKTVVPRIQQPWFSDSLHQAKRERRKAERKWISSGLTDDYEHFTELKNKYNNNALYSAKCNSSIVRSLIVVMTLNQCLMSSAPFFRRNDPPSFLITALHLNWQIGLQRILLLRYRLLD